MSMPTYERRFFLNTLKEENIKRKEMHDEMMANVKSDGKGKKTNRIGGEELKSKIKSGEMPEI